MCVMNCPVATLSDNAGRSPMPGGWGYRLTGGMIYQPPHQGRDLNCRRALVCECWIRDQYADYDVIKGDHLLLIFIQFLRF